MPNPTPMGTVPSTSSPNILEWVLVVLMVVTIAGLGYLYLTLTQLRDSVTATKADVMTVKSEVMTQKEVMVEDMDESVGVPYGNGDLDGYAFTNSLGGLPFWYPEAFYAELRRLDPASGQISLMVTSHPGKLSMSPEIGRDSRDIEIFDSGYELRLYQISSEEYTSLDTGVELNALPTDNPFVKSVYAACVGTITEEGVEDCFFESYIVQFRGTAYRIDIRALSDYAAAEEITNEIIRRIGQQ